MNKNKIISTFSNYVQAFGLSNQFIAQKFQHSMNVANYCLDIADFLLLDNDLKNTAFLLGLLHEFGSFEAISKNTPELYHKLTLDLLFREEKIKKYTTNTSEINLIKKVLTSYQSQKKENTPLLYDFPIKTQNDKINLLLSILKDADTLELFGIFKRGTIIPTINPDFKKTSFSKPVLDSFRSNKKVDRSLVSSTLDKALFFVSLFFELNYLISKNTALKIEFEKGILQTYKPFLSEEEVQKLEKILNSFRKKHYPKK